MDHNRPLLQKLHDHIETHPDEHDQFTWGWRGSCGTVLCAAARTAWLTGWELVWAPEPDSSGDDLKMVRHPETGEERTVAAAARDELGLTKDEAQIMFCECDDRDSVLNYIEELLAAADHA